MLMRSLVLRPTLWPSERAGSLPCGVAIGLVLFAVNVSSPAVAGSRGIGIGLGVVTGLSVLNKLDTGKTRRSRSTKHRVATKKSSGSSRKSHDDDEETPAKKATEEKDGNPTSGQNAEGNGKLSDAKPADEKEGDTRPASASMTNEPGKSAKSDPVRDGAPGVPGGDPRAAKIATLAEISTAQEHLRYLGYDVKGTNGVLDLETKIAIMKFQDSIGAPATGDLTVGQLQRMFVLAAERQRH